MIRLNKLEEPSILRNNKDDWKKEYLNALAHDGMTDTIRYRHRNPEIKEQIKKETGNKCAYCESKITHTYPGDIEHILPRSVFPDLTVDWENLTLGCGECNRRKSNYYSATEPLINPYIDNPEDHLLAAGTLILGRPGDRKGQLTELKLELNRAQLIERRHERIKSLVNLADRYAKQEDGYSVADL